MIEINLKDLSPEHQGILKVNESDFYYNIFIKRHHHKSLFVFFQGAVDKSKTQPNFQRISWSEKIPANIVIFSDPTVDNNSLTIGWSQHSPKVNYFYRTAELIKKYALSIDVEEDNIFLYGSSAGGFTALMVAAYFTSATVIVNNPQTDWTLFYKNKVTEVLNSIYDNMELSEYKTKFPNRFNISVVYKNIGRVPRLFYMQNIDDDFHYRNHFLPFFDFITKSKIHITSFNPILYTAPTEGHSPRGMEDTLKILNMAMLK